MNDSATASKVSSPDIAAVVFDMDGIIFDSEQLYFAAGVDLLAARGHQFTVELAHKIMGMPAITSMQVLRDELSLADDCQVLFDESQALFQSKLGALQMMPGFRELLAAVEQRGLPCAVATSTVRAITERMLDAFSLRPHFQFILTRENITHGKPHPEIYLLACKRLQLEPRRVLVLEDSLNGSKAAKAAGCITVAVPHELSRALDFSFADLIADNLADPRLLALVSSTSSRGNTG